MDFFEKHKALIITVLLFAVLFLAMYNINISRSNQKVRETLIELNNLRAEEPKKQEQPKTEQQPETPPRQRQNFETHQAFNQNQEESRRNFESRLDEIFEKNSASQEASEEESTSTSSGDLNLEPNRRQKRQKASEGNDTSEELSTQKGSLRNSSISFSLVGRSAIEIPNPIYTCDTSGKIVVNITVDSDGRVIDTSVNKRSSTSSNECLTEMALDYASGARFSKLPGRTSQPGTITYYFQD
ncbi:energy transducer TonB [Salinimicrobium catena]|uniref:energy transducer TonB family protein n=1 Tax=Salinimicrobium catena TaxID=390640 RepID=UPI002FE493A2